MKIIYGKDYGKYVKRYDKDIKSGRLTYIKKSEVDETDFEVRKVYNRGTIKKKGSKFLLDSHKRYYFIDDVYYEAPIFTFRERICLITGIFILIAGAAVGGHFLYKKFKTQNINTNTYQVANTVSLNNKTIDSSNLTITFTK